MIQQTKKDKVVNFHFFCEKQRRALNFDVFFPCLKVCTFFFSQKSSEVNNFFFCLFLPGLHLRQQLPRGCHTSIFFTFFFFFSFFFVFFCCSKTRKRQGNFSVKKKWQNKLIFKSHKLNNKKKRKQMNVQKKKRTNSFDF
jgi:hypothetical protein